LAPDSASRHIKVQVSGIDNSTIGQTGQHGHNPLVTNTPSPNEPEAPRPRTPREEMEAKLLASPQCRAIVPGGSTAFFIRSPEELAAWKKQLGRSKRPG
jgi:hypothetical protein